MDRARLHPSRSHPRAPLSTPSITGPLQAAPPNLIGGERFGDVSINGVVSGTGLLQGNHFPGDHLTEATLTNGQMFIQKTTGWWQFYVQAGAYDIPALGTPFLTTDKDRYRSLSARSRSPT